MRDEQREDERQDEDRDDERLPVADELDGEPVGYALAEARLLHGRSDEVGADDHPHLHLRPGGEDRRGVRRACKNQEREVDGGDEGGLSHAARPPDHGHEREGEALLALLTDGRQVVEWGHPDERQHGETGKEAHRLLVESH